MTAAVRALLAAGASFSDHVYDYRDQAAPRGRRRRSASTSAR